MRGRCRWAQKCGGTPQPLAALATAPSPALVIARSDSDEAIQLPRKPLDCFADARNDDMDFILPREAGKGDHPAQQGGGSGVGLQASSAARPLHHPSGGPPPPHFVRGRIKRNRSRDALTRPSFANHDDAKNRFASGNQRGKRSAERRMPSMSASAQTSVRDLRHLSAPRLRAHNSSLPRLRGRVREGRARLSALTLAALATGYHPDGSAPEPGFPKTDFASVLPARPACLRLSTLRADRSLCRSTGDPEPPGSGLAYPRAGTAPRFRLSGLPFRKGALNERGVGVRNWYEDGCQ